MAQVFWRSPRAKRACANHSIAVLRLLRNVLSPLGFPASVKSPVVPKISPPRRTRPLRSGTYRPAAQRSSLPTQSEPLGPPMLRFGRKWGPIMPETSTLPKSYSVAPKIQPVVWSSLVKELGSPVGAHKAPPSPRRNLWLFDSWTFTRVSKRRSWMLSFLTWRPPLTPRFCGSWPVNW